jgi:MFS family permease
VSIVSATLSRTERRAYEANIWKLFLYTFLMDFQLWWPLWVVYLRETRGFSLTQVTVLDAPFWLVIVFAEVPTGAVADRWGRKWSLLLGAVSFSWAIVVFGLSSNYALILVSYLGWAVALTLQSGANSALLFDSLKALGREGDFERLTGSLFAVMSAAGLGGILLGAPFAAATNLATPIVVSGLIAVFAAPVAFSMKEPPIAEHERSENYVGLLRDSVSLVRSRPAVLRMLVYAALIGVAAYRASALLGGRSLFAVLPAVMVASYCLLGAWGSVYAYVAFLPIAAMQGFSRPATGNYIHQRIPSGQRATILSFSQLLFSLALAPVEPALGFIADRWGLQRVFWTLALGTAAVGGGAYLWWLRADDDAHELVPSEGPRAPGSFEGTEDAEQTGAGRLP